MDIPRRGGKLASGALPEIHIHDPSERSRCSSRSISHSSTSSLATSATAMSIPNAREAPPPPLPPPRQLADIIDGGYNGQDIAWKWGNLPDGEGYWGKSTPAVAPDSSLRGGSFLKRSLAEERPEPARKTSSTATIKTLDQIKSSDQKEQRDEGYASLGTSTWSHKLVLWFSCLASVQSRNRMRRRHIFF